MTIEVRRLTLADAPAMLAIRREMLISSPAAFGSDPANDRFQSVHAVEATINDPLSAIVGGWHNGTLAAVAGIRREDRPKRAHIASIWGVYTRPAARGLGLGRGVVAGVVEIAQSWPGVTQVQLAVSEAAEPAYRLYASLGFVEWGREPDALRVEGVLHGEIHMSLKL